MRILLGFGARWSSAGTIIGVEVFGAAAGIRTPDRPVFSPDIALPHDLEHNKATVTRGSPSNRLTTVGTRRLQGTPLTDTQSQVNPGPCLEVIPELLAEFQHWLLEEQGTSRKTVWDYMRYLARLEGLSLCGKPDAGKAFQLMGLNKTSYEAFSRFLTYLEKKTAFEELALSLRKGLPWKPRSREDTYVPPDQTVAQAIGCASSLGRAYRLYALILAYTRLRGSEARRILEERESLRTVELPYGAVRVHLDMVKGE